LQCNHLSRVKGNEELKGHQQILGAGIFAYLIQMCEHGSAYYRSNNTLSIP
jgi:uncharacterized protein YbcV (DUF1398 family)